jgi:hypothetical protein
MEEPSKLKKIYNPHLRGNIKPTLDNNEKVKEVNEKVNKIN